jgi:hypothetical protein
MNNKKEYLCKMKTKLLLIVCVFVFAARAFSSEKELMDIIIDDINASIVLYGNSPSNHELHIFDTITRESIYFYDFRFILKKYIELIKIKKTSCWSNKKNRNYTLYVIDIRIDYEWFSGFKYHPNILTYDTLTYVVLKVGDTYYYKLFGFGSTNIKGLDKKEFLFVADKLLKNKLLSEEELHYYKKSILCEEYVIHSKVNRPCEYFKYFYKYYNYEHVNTIILKKQFLNIPRLHSTTEIYFKGCVPCK